MAQFRTVLTVVAAKEPLSFESLGARTGLDYKQVANQIAQTSDGRGARPGLRLLKRDKAEMGRAKLVLPSRTGCCVASLFVFPGKRGADNVAKSTNCASSVEDYTQLVTLPAIDLMCRQIPPMSLGTFSVLLYIALNQEEFAYEGLPVMNIAQHLGIANLPRHLAMLGNGIAGKPGADLISLVDKENDRRVALPRLTHAGGEVLASLFSKLLGRPAETPRRAKEEVLKALDSPDQVDDLPPESFEDLDFKNSRLA